MTPEPKPSMPPDNPPDQPSNQRNQKPVVPRFAAAAIVMTDEADPRALMIKRSDRMRFMAGHHVKRY